MKKAAINRTSREDAQDVRLALRRLKNSAKTHTANEVKRQLGLN
jgi:hypothetical protein